MVQKPLDHYYSYSMRQQTVRDILSLKHQSAFIQVYNHIVSMMYILYLHKFLHEVQMVKLIEAEAEFSVLDQTNVPECQCSR